jgi:serine-type D-Ala-D-Ala carboxypeptidase/endopeptidase (penicillin-binding protein 4)
MHKLFTLISLACALASCSPITSRKLNKTFSETEKTFQDFTGFMLYDLEKKKSVYEYNADKYFTPASNTKIFTFFTSLNILGDSVPALRYVERGDSLIFWGTGDPSFLYKFTHQNRIIFDFLKTTEKSLYFSPTNFNTTHFGSGWAWDDYNDVYTVERSPFPVYGNIFTVEGDRSIIKVQPPLLERHFTLKEELATAKVIRKIDNNDFLVYPSDRKKFELDVPMKIDPDITRQLLSDTINKDVHLIHFPMVKEAKTLYSIPSDSLYSVMMKASDNFIAEQLLLLCSGMISDTLQPEITIKYSKQTLLNDLADKPIWVDGSGLSRYNLFTPRSIVDLWRKIYQLVPEQRLFSLLAVGGKSGTIRKWYKSEKPYVFGKTGSLSNNHCLSGYLVTKKGKTLIFSFMNSNFTASSSEIRNNMQNILNSIYEQY